MWSALPAARSEPRELKASEYTVLAGPVSRARRSGRPGARMFHSSTVRPAPAAARREPSGLNATAYSGSRRLAASSGAPAGTG